MDGNNNQFTQGGQQVPPQGYGPYVQQAPPQGYGPYVQQASPQGYGPYVQQPVPPQGYDPYAQQPVYAPYNVMPPPFDKKSAKKHFSGVGMSYFLFSVVAAAVQMIASVAVDIINPDLWDNYLFMLLASILPMYLVGAPVCIGMMKRLPSEKPEKNPWGPGRFIVGLIIAVGLMYTGSFIGTYIGLLIEAVNPEATASTNNVQELVFSGDMFINIIIMVIVGPIVEELLFRKVLCDRLRIYGEGVTVVVTGLMFGIFHGNLTQSVYAFLLGCFLAYVYLKTGRVAVTIAYHITLNFIGSVVPLLALRSTDIDGLEEIISTGDTELITEFVSNNTGSFLVYGLYSMAVLGCMFVGIILIIIMAATGRIKFAPGRFRIPSGMRFSVVIINVGMILFILSGIAEILLNMFL